MSPKRGIYARIPRMDRRSFFRTMVGGVATSAAVRTWPFRVFSFPSNVCVPKHRFNFVKGYYPFHSFTVDLELPCMLTDEPMPEYRAKSAVIVDGEVVAIKSWDPRTERLIVTRGTATREAL